MRNVNSEAVSDSVQVTSGHEIEDCISGDTDDELVFDPSTGVLSVVKRSDDSTDTGTGEDKDTVPVTIIAKEGFFSPMQRLLTEEEILKRYLPSFRIQNIETPDAGVIGCLTTNNRRSYALWIPLGNFPYGHPRMYVVKPAPLMDRDGRPLADRGTSHTMHLLEPDNHGHPQICHYNDQHWHQDVTLYKVVIKGRIWLESYEIHLRTGENIDLYLRHMDEDQNTMMED